MNDVSSEWVVYAPPKSVSFGHQTSPRDPRKAWPLVKRFLSDFAQVTRGPADGHAANLTCYGPDAGVDPAVADARLLEARRRLGPSKKEGGTFGRWERWGVSNAQFEDAIQFSLDDDVFPKQPMGPTRLTFSFIFSWSDFERHSRGDLNDTRRETSTLGVIMGGRKLFLQPRFVFPAASDSERLHEFLIKLEYSLPFRFRNQYFKRVLRPTGKGETGRTLKLDKMWRQSIGRSKVQEG